MKNIYKRRLFGLKMGVGLFAVLFISSVFVLASSTPAWAAKVNDECPNGVIDGMGGNTEECDDGESIDLNQCLSDCTLNVCGDGIVLLVASDDIALDDGLVASDPEECDDGNSKDGDGCSVDCENEVDPECGDDILQAGELCDDGNTESGDGCSDDCLPEGCGNFLVQEGEECDDGNETNDDICNNQCKFNAQTSCGNGTVEAPEFCDDGNNVDGDGCSNACGPDLLTIIEDFLAGGDDDAGDGGAGADDTDGGGCSLIAPAATATANGGFLLLAGIGTLAAWRRRIR